MTFILLYDMVLVELLRGTQELCRTLPKFLMALVYFIRASLKRGAGLGPQFIIRVTCTKYKFPVLDSCTNTRMTMLTLPSYCFDDWVLVLHSLPNESYLLQNSNVVANSYTYNKEFLHNVCIM